MVRISSGPPSNKVIQSGNIQFQIEAFYSGEAAFDIAR